MLFGFPRRRSPPRRPVVVLPVIVVSALDLTLRAEAHSGSHQGLPLRRCRGGVSYFEVCGVVSDEVAALGRIACLPREYPPGTSMGSQNPLTSHLDGRRP